MNAKSLTVVPGGNRFTRRKEKTRQELLVAAGRVLADKGFHDAKITDIATAADVGVGTFYLHFATKDALFDALVDDAIQRLKDAVDAARHATHDPVERMKRANGAFCRFAQDNRQVFRIVFGHPAAHHEAIRRAQDLFAADVEENIRQGIAAGAFAPIPSAIAAQAVVGMVTQLLSWWTEHDAIAIDTLEDAMGRIALQGIALAAPNQKDTR